MTTFVNLRTLAAQRFTDPGHAVVADAAGSLRNWTDYVNQAYKEVLRASVLWPWNESAEQTVTVLANTRGIALPTGTFQVNWVYDVTNDRYINSDQGRGSQWRSPGRQLRSSTAAIADTYKLRAGNIELYPQVQVATQLALECVIYPAALSLDADLPVFPDVYHEILLDGALALAYLDDGNADQYNLHWTSFQASIAKMAADLLQFRDVSYPPVRDTFWSN